MMDLPDGLDEPMLTLSHFTPTIWHHESNRINGFRRPLPQGYLTHQGNPYTKHQQFLYTLIKCLHDKGYGYRRIAHKLNAWNVKTTRGKTWFNTSVSSVLKRKHERDVRIQEIRNKEYPIKIGKLSVKYYTY